MTIVWDASAEGAAAVRAQLPEPVLALTEAGAVVDLVGRDPQHTLLVIGPGVELGDALSVCEHVQVTRMRISVILMRSELDTSTLMAAMRAGVREVVDATDPTALAQARLRHVSTNAGPAPVPSPSADAPRGQVVTVFAAKGGCGKTTVATNLAVVLAAAGQRVCLVDLDLLSGDVAITLGLPPTRTLAALGSIDTPLDAATVSTLLTPFSPTLSCALAPAHPGEAERITPAGVSGLIDVLTGMFDYIVLDTPPQLNEHVLAGLDASHLHVLLTTPEVPSLKNLRVTIDMLDLLSYDRSRRVVLLNRADDEVGLKTVDVEAVIQSPVICHVPTSRDVPMSINQGRPLAQASPEHPVAVALRSLAAAHLLREGDLAGPNRRRRAGDLVATVPTAGEAPARRLPRLGRHRP